VNPVDTWSRRDIVVSALYNENEKTVEYLIQHGPYRFRRPHACPHPSWYWSPEENKANSLSEAKKYLIMAMNKNISRSYQEQTGVAPRTSKFRESRPQAWGWGSFLMSTNI
ncbi:hypothetical protein V7161_18695, partial [Neobacillus drentensis]|uniref:hypothetical protein n=1 Tax=Neobacillus drentensis TaxID=220684 RepID=UPI003000FD6F